MLSNSLRMIKIDRNMSEFWWIVCKNVILKWVHLLGFIEWIILKKRSYGLQSWDGLTTLKLEGVPKLLISEKKILLNIIYIFGFWPRGRSEECLQYFYQKIFWDKPLRRHRCRWESNVRTNLKERKWHIHWIGCGVYIIISSVSLLHNYSTQNINL